MWHWMGWERLFDAEDADGRPQAPAFRKGRNKGIAVIRYADDFVITAPTGKYWKPTPDREVVEFLRATRTGTERSQNPDHAYQRRVELPGVSHQEIREQGEKLLTVPQKEKVLKHVRAIRSYLDAHKHTPAGQVIKELNPVIRGWANYYRHSCGQRCLLEGSTCPMADALELGETPTPEQKKSMGESSLLSKRRLLDIL